MSAFKRNRFLWMYKNIDNSKSKEDKFSLINCSINGFYCKSDILPEINRLYNESETYRINREYLESIELLRLAYQQTRKLEHSECAVCVSFFQHNIQQTLELMHKELINMSKGIFSRNRHQHAFQKIDEVVRNLKSFENHSTRKIPLRKAI